MSTNEPLHFRDGSHAVIAACIEVRITGVSAGLRVSFHVPALREGGLRRMTRKQI